MVNDVVEAVQPGGREEASGDPFDDGASCHDGCLLFICETAVEILPELVVEVLVLLHVDHLAGAQDARSAEVVEQRIGRDLGGHGVIEANVRLDFQTLDRLEQVHDDDRDALLVCLLHRGLDDLYFDRRNGDDVHFTLDVVLDDRYLVVKGNVRRRRLRNHLDLEAMRVRILSRQLEEVGGGLEDASDVGRGPADDNGFLPASHRWRLWRLCPPTGDCQQHHSQGRQQGQSQSLPCQHSLYSSRVSPSRELKRNERSHSFGWTVNSSDRRFVSGAPPLDPCQARKRQRVEVNAAPVKAFDHLANCENVRRGVFCGNWHQCSRQGIGISKIAELPSSAADSGIARRKLSGLASHDLPDLALLSNADKLNLKL